MTEETAAPARRAKRVCEGCFGYDADPKMTIWVTPEGPLGRHTPGRIVEITNLLRDELPPNVGEIAAMDAADAEKAVAGLPPGQADAMISIAFLMDDTTWIGHMDCYQALAEDVKLQRSLDDATKITPGDHATAGVDAGLRGKKLVDHLTSQAKPEEH